MRTLVMLHENLSRRLGTSLSAYLRTMVQMEVASVDQMTYEEFTRSLPNPTVINILYIKRLEGNVILEFTPQSGVLPLSTGYWGGAGAAITLSGS